MPPTTFSELSHIDQLGVLEELTCSALPIHYAIADTATTQIQQYEDNAVWWVTSPRS